jgi:beta-lactam-binding protein with PASTA domain
VGRAGDAPWVAIPKVVGLSLSEAKSRLWERGFNVGTVAFDEDINAISQRDATVYQQTPGYGRTAAMGTRVNIDLTLDDNKITDGNSAADRASRRAIQQSELEAARAAAAEAEAAVADTLQQ